jgi:protease stability complex PrcB-like protein
MFNYTTAAGTLVISLVFAFGTLTNPAAPNLQNDKPAASSPNASLIGDLKVLAEGPQSSVREPFVALCRDAETYEALKKLDKALPKLEKDFFQTHLVIAAYLGTRNTGGYRVIITRQGEYDLPSPYRGYVRVHEQGPAKNAIVTQAITTPFAVVSLEVNGTPPLTLGLDNAWTQKQKPYRIRNGSFSMGGGLAGTSEVFEAHGEVVTLRARGLLSFYFVIRGTGGSKERSLTDFATGILDKEAITIKRLSSGSFVDGPNAGFSATGTLRERDQNLALQFSSLRAIVSDGYSGAGSFEAVPAQPSTKQ